MFIFYLNLWWTRLIELRLWYGYATVTNLFYYTQARHTWVGIVILKLTILNSIELEVLAEDRRIYFLWFIQNMWSCWIYVRYSKLRLPFTYNGSSGDSVKLRIGKWIVSGMGRAPNWFTSEQSAAESGGLLGISRHLLPFRPGSPVRSPHVALLWLSCVKLRLQHVIQDLLYNF